MISGTTKIRLHITELAYTFVAKDAKATCSRCPYVVISALLILIKHYITDISFVVIRGISNGRASRYEQLMSNLANIPYVCKVDQS